MTRTILHVDMDAFYASVEQRDHPEYRLKPVIVGSDPQGGKGRGIVATCSYEARKFGVHSAQPISRAWKLCPQGIYVRPDMEKYGRVSGMVMRILLGFTDMLEQVSIDEAFLDVTGSLRLFGFGAEIAATVAEKAFDALKAPVVRLAGPDAPAASSWVLEQAFVPQADAIAAAARSAMARSMVLATA